MVDDEELEATIQAGQKRDDLGPMGVSVVVLSGEQRGVTVPLRGKVRVGKAPDNELVVGDQTVSRHHCEISRVPAGVRVRDLGSTNGTYVEHARITDAVTPVGSVVRISDGVELALRPSLEMLEIEPYPDDDFEGVIGRGVAMRRIFRVLDGVARTDATVLLQGETGTGKEVLARALVRRSLRREPFVVVDCGSVTPTLIQSELFGHERGAFTGAIAQRKGAFESAQGGTIFLDEIGELPTDVQHDWPGNVRELRNLLERAAYMSAAAGSRELLLPSLPSSGGEAGGELFHFSLAESYREARARVEDEFERRYVAWLLGEHKGNLSAAARAAQMDRKHLHVLARKHGLREGGED